jgi:hypothetical protein
VKVEGEHGLCHSEGVSRPKNLVSPKGYEILPLRLRLEGQDDTFILLLSSRERLRGEDNGQCDT